MFRRKVFATFINTVLILFVLAWMYDDYFTRFGLLKQLLILITLKSIIDFLINMWDY